MAEAAAVPAAERAASGIGHYLWVCLKSIWRGIMYLFGLLTSCLTKLPIKYASLLLRILNLGNAVLLAAACVFIFMKAKEAGVNLSVTQTFLSVYIAVFALLLGAFEMRVKWTEGSIRRNFGFMFTYMGRALFLIFLSAVCFGMLNSDQASTPWYSWAAGAGAGTLINAVINCIIICSHPGFQEMSKQADEEFSGNGGAAAAKEDPTKMSEEQIAAYLKAHPEIAAKALSAVTASQAQPSSAFTGDASGMGAGAGAGDSAAGVAEWGAVSSKPGHSPAADAAGAKSTTTTGGGFFGFGKKKDKGGKGAGAAAAEGSEMTSSAPYQPPAGASSFTDVSISSSAADGGDNPFAAGAGATGRVSPAAHSAPSAHPPAASRSLPPAPPSHTTSAAVVVPPPAAAASDMEDNPFAS